MSNRLKFFNKKHEFLSLQQILEITNSKLIQEADQSLKISDVATISEAKNDQISFLSAAQYFSKLETAEPCFCFISEENYEKATQKNDKITFLVAKNPYYAYSQIVAAFYEEKTPEFSDSNIHETAQIGENSIISPLAYIGKDVKIGKNCFIAPNAAILDGCTIGDNVKVNSSATISFANIGDNCVIYSGARIGQDGFGFVHEGGVNHKILQIGTVEIGDNVEIGANSCVDRGAIGDTKIGNDVKIDNLVQIAHNVEIGQGSVVAGCGAVAGSTKIGRFVQIGGNSSISGHIEVGDGAKIAGMSGVIKNVEPMSVIGGIPALPIRQWHKSNALIANLLKNKKKD